MPTLTPTDAAKRSGLSRRTVMRAITGGALAAQRTNTGWMITEADYEAWTAAHAQPMSAPSPLPTLLMEDAQPEPTVMDERIYGLEALVAVLRSSNADLRSANDELRADRDTWRAMAQRSWWKRLVG